MTRSMFWGALAGALLLLWYVAPVSARPICNGADVMRPCAPSIDQVRVRLDQLTSRREARQARRAERFRNVEFGSPMYPPETARGFLGKSSGLVAPLAAKLASIQSACPGTATISGVRHTYIAGTRRISLHASGKAVDVRGPYGCIYAELRGWQGGYSTDAGRMRHIHISYDAQGGREMGLAFRHGGGRKHARHRHGHRVAEAGR